MSSSAMFQPALVFLAVFLFLSETIAEQSVYNQGDPTQWEQYMLELVNRARANPLAEADRYGLVDLNESLPGGTITPDAKQPLVLNPFLMTSARAHSQWMIDTDTFSHVGLNNTSATDRIIAAGYPLTGSWGTGENIAAFLGWKSDQRRSTIEFHHEGLFLSAGHRENILEPEFDEIGIGEIMGSYFYNGSDHPQSSLLTQNFAYSWGSPVPDGYFLTGVVFEDMNGDGFYTPGEGVGGVEVRPVSGSWYAVTSSSGGYAFPVGFESKTVEVAFSGSGFSPTTKSVNLPGGANVKVDFLIGVDDVPDPFVNADPQSDGWFSIDWFGWFTQPRSDWVYNSKAGFMFYFTLSEGELLLFDPVSRNWSWTTTDLFPIHYRLGDNPGWAGY